MKFSQVPGHSVTKARLIKSVQESRVSHAQIFAGPEGSGSFALALAYSMYISCENRTETDSCGVCKSCVKYAKLIHPDLHFVFPVIKEKKKTVEPVSDIYISQWREMVLASPFFTLESWLNSLETGNLQGMIYTAEAAEIIKKLSLKTFESDYKTMIIWLPEKMNPTASNKLLKLIEEPPERTLFLLVSEEPDKLLPTILSRCQLIRIPVFSRDEIKNYLESQYGTDPGKAGDIARISLGNISRAASLCASQETSHMNLERFRQLMRLAYKRDVLSLMGWSEEVSSGDREAMKTFLAYSLRMIRENLMLTLGQAGNGIVFLSGEEAEFSEKFHPFINNNNVERLHEEFNLAHAHLESNGNGKIIFLDLALRVAKVLR